MKLYVYPNRHRGYLINIYQYLRINQIDNTKGAWILQGGKESSTAFWMFYDPSESFVPAQGIQIWPHQ